jgi:hypothetical protein
VYHFSELNRAVWFSPESENVYFIYRGKRNQTGRRVAEFVDDRPRREEKIVEPLSTDESAEKSRQQVGEDYQSHKADYEYEYLYDYLHTFIVEGGRDRFLSAASPLCCLRLRVAVESGCEQLGKFLIQEV